MWQVIDATLLFRNPGGQKAGSLSQQGGAFSLFSPPKKSLADSKDAAYSNDPPGYMEFIQAGQVKAR